MRTNYMKRRSCIACGNLCSGVHCQRCVLTAAGRKRQLIADRIRASVPHPQIVKELHVSFSAVTSVRKELGLGYPSSGRPPRAHSATQTTAETFAREVEL